MLIEYYTSWQVLTQAVTKILQMHYNILAVNIHVLI